MATRRSWLSPEALHNIIGLWHGESATVQPLGSSTNHLLFGFSATGRRLVLRLSLAGYRDPAHVEEEFAWVRYLGENGILACQPLQSRNGCWVETIDHPVDGACVAVVTREARGVPLVLSNEYLFGPLAPGTNPQDAPVFREWGRTSARMHKLAAGFSSATGFQRNLLDGPALSDLAARVLPAAERPVAETLRQCWDEIQRLPVDSESYGVIHGDFTAANLFVNDGQIEIFDFDNCCQGWFIYDISITIYATLMALSQRADYRGEAEFFISRFMNGYRSERQLDAFWLSAVPLFLRFFNTLAYVAASQQSDSEAGVVRSFAAANLGADAPAFDLNFSGLYSFHGGYDGT